MKPITTLGFVGLGVMGEPMCRNLVTKTTLPVHGTDLKREPVERLAANGLKPSDSIADVAAAADCILLSLHSPKAVEEVCGAIAAAKGARAHTILDMSTTPVRLTRELHGRLAAQGITLVDAPVAGMRARAHAGTLSIMVGGSADAFAAVAPHLSHMGEATHCGDVGCGQIVKALNNMVVFMTANALAEAITIGRRAGMDAQLLFETMAKGSSDSAVLRTGGLKHLVPDYFPEDAFPTDYALKDISLALELARDVGVNAPAAQHTRDLLEATSRAGYGRNYYPAMVKLIEKG
jgi:3-hydroxyisobutyrate dehydrogenase-like beta-hydroxyacid dehydrogenase